MKFDTTRQPLGVVLITISLLIILFWTRAIQCPVPMETSGVWLSCVGEYISLLTDGFWGHIASMILIVVNGVIVTRIGTKNILYTAKTFIPFIFYTILSCGIYVSYQSFNIILGSTIVLVALEVFITGFHRQRNVGSCFGGAVLIGLGGLIYTPLYILLPLIPFILALFFRDDRERIAAIIGSLVPLFVVSYIEWGLGGEFLGTTSDILKSFITKPDHTLNFQAITLSSGFIFSIVIIVTTLSIGAMAASRRHIRARAMRISFGAVLMLFGFTTLLVLPCSSSAVIQLMAIPIAIIAPHLFVHYTGKASFILYTLLIISVVMLNITRML